MQRQFLLSKVKSNFHFFFSIMIIVASLLAAIRCFIKVIGNHATGKTGVGQKMTGKCKYCKYAMWGGDLGFFLGLKMKAY